MLLLIDALYLGRQTFSCSTIYDQRSGLLSFILVEIHSAITNNRNTLCNYYVHLDICNYYVHLDICNYYVQLDMFTSLSNIRSRLNKKCVLFHIQLISVFRSFNWQTQYGADLYPSTQ